METDYIIIGGGSAGCVLANRLSTDPKARVLLIEAGSNNNALFVKMPAGFGEIVPTANAHNYGFETEPEPHLHNRRLYWPRGRGLGGSSAINAMVYIRGNAWDYDHWNQLGNKGWSYASVLPYFKRAESFEGDGDLEYHGRDGMLSVLKSQRSDDILLDKFVEAGIQAGFPYTKDFNGRHQEGFSRYEHTIRDNQRCSAARGYLEPVQKRENLEIITHTIVDKILSKNKRAYGVSTLTNGIAGEYTARREIILASGAVNSPQILLRSGIGDPVDIKPHGLELVHDLKGVGKNLQDHLGVVSQFACTQPVTLHRSATWWRKTLAGIRYLLFRNGDAAWPPTAGGAFVRSNPDKDIPDTQMHYVSVAIVDSHGREKLQKRHGFSNIIYSCRPQSRGYITLKDTAPQASPAIFANYLSEPQDIIDLRNGFRQGRQVMMQDAFAAYRGEELKPGNDINVDKDDEIDDWIKNTAETLYHPVGTCKMGTADDPTAVVDTNGCVYGMKNLRVCDASLMPTLIGGNTNAPTIMMAEKISDHIRGENFLKPDEHI